MNDFLYLHCNVNGIKYLFDEKEYENRKWEMIFVHSLLREFIYNIYKMIQAQYDLKLKGWSVFITSSDKSTYSAKNDNVAFILQVWTSIVVRLVCLSKPEMRKCS